MTTRDTHPRPTTGNITLLKHAAATAAAAAAAVPAAAAPLTGVSTVSHVALHAEGSGPLNPCPWTQKSAYDAPFGFFGTTLP